jgi:hypothetical protein
MSRTLFLLPRSFRFVGFVFLIAGLLLGIARFYFGYKPHLLDMKVFAFYSSYLQTKYMEIVRNNMAEEFTGFFLVTGLFLIAFSREKVENELTSMLRFKAFFIAFYLNFLFLLISLFFTFGFAFVYMLMVNMGFGLLAFILTFRFLLFLKSKKVANP